MSLDWLFLTVYDEEDRFGVFHVWVARFQDEWYRPPFGIRIHFLYGSATETLVVDIFGDGFLEAYVL